eukprot:CAMPEP_0180046662 /NCGR_PEP_ID=MMETSP0984-20121128/37343_1 /TAXON_ID=483367 /ORGANISM="non described non described, Strain CCMP 2436" /LENGTH=191 /DNA_ID=CAMNT_0021975445 /DNA_START=96 /DNA_END=672 /DNA_ORIENTATION=+
MKPQARAPRRSRTTGQRGAPPWKADSRNRDRRTAPTADHRSPITAERLLRVGAARTRDLASLSAARANANLTPPMLRLCHRTDCVNAHHPRVNAPNPSRGISVHALPVEGVDRREVDRELERLVADYLGLACAAAFPAAGFMWGCGAWGCGASASKPNSSPAIKDETKPEPSALSMSLDPVRSCKGAPDSV